ncbi:MAG TPA: class I SAM-dependent methyltransferase [Solirubrobacteraceae bacterium]|jgi:SAM-dependent methyltransferase|nr:class I SAM-dependent methyltransferase [Solirubrobacteraceae bacterium]
MTVQAADPDWSDLLDAWDRQQRGYLPHREQRFSAMLDALHAAVGDSPLALDFACGPGSISQRLLERCPRARAVAIDLDPVLLAIGSGSLGTMGGRLTWLQSDLRRPDWTTRIGGVPFDAALSSTAVHWLKSAELVDAYRLIASILRPGGIALLADNMPFAPEQRMMRHIVATLERARHEFSFEIEGVRDWARWWAWVGDHPGLAGLFTERESCHRPLAHELEDRSAAAADDRSQPSEGMPTLAQHVAALSAAGFEEVDVIWQDLDDRVLVAVRSGTITSP